MFPEYIVQTSTYVNHATNSAGLRVTGLEQITAPPVNSSKMEISVSPNVSKTSTKNTAFANFVITIALMDVQVPDNLLAMEDVILAN